MAISKILKTAIKAISYSNIELKKNYKLLRTFDETVHKINTVMGVSSYDEKIANVSVRVYSLNKVISSKIIVFLHGGGWVSGSVNSYDATCANICKHTKCKVISVDYSLAPEKKFPYALNECYEVISDINKFFKLLDKDKNELIIMGDSAGANLCAAISQMARDKGEFKIEKQILLYPVTNNDHSENSEFNSVRENGEEYILTSKHLKEYVEMYINDESDLVNPYMAPLLAKDYSKQPDTLIITAEFDPLRDEGEEYGIRLKKAGNDVEVYRIKDALHGFFMLSPRISQVKTTYQYINEFLDK